MHELLALVVARKTTLRLRPDELKTAQNMAGIMTFEKIDQLVRILGENSYYIERNANPKILFLDSSIQINRILKCT